MQEKKIPDLVRAIRDNPVIRVAVEIAGDLKYPLFLVGGWIRDRYIGTTSQDYDFIVEGDVALFARRVAKKLGASFFAMGHEDPPNYRILSPAFTMDMVPQNPLGLDQELGRRDFTVNTIAFSFSQDRLLDPFGGCKDIEDRILRAVSPEALDADPLRMLRAVRLITVLEGFSLSEETVFAIRKGPDRLSESASERIREEMDRIMVSGRAREGLLLMRNLGLLGTVLPECLSLSGLDQGPYHHLDALSHTLEAVGEADALDFQTGSFRYAYQLDREDRTVLAYAALLHDIGKPAARTWDSDGTPHFYGHEKIGAEMSEEVMRRLSFSGRRAERVSHLILYHVLGLGLVRAGYTPKALRRIVRKLGEDLPLHVLLSLLDRRAARGKEFSDMEKKTVSLGQALLDLYAEEGEEILDLPKLISGEDVKEILGLEEGRAVGKVIEKVRKLQIDQEIRTRDQALRFLHSLRKA